MANSRLNLTYRDWNNEGSQAGFRGEALTAANFAGKMADLDALVVAVEAVTLCNLTKDIRVATETNPGAGPASDANAQRERKWLVTMFDVDSGIPVHVQIPGADASLLLPNSDQMDTATAEYVALKTNIEKYHLSIAGGAVEITDVVMVGRNL